MGFLLFNYLLFNNCSTELNRLAEHLAMGDGLFSIDIGYTQLYRRFSADKRLSRFFHQGGVTIKSVDDATGKFRGFGDLGKIGALQVISRTSVMQYKGMRKPLPEIARELGVDAIVEGSVLRAGDRVRITATLIDGRTDRQIWTETYERDLRDILEIQSSVARSIAREIHTALTPEQSERLARTRSVDPAAHEAYLKGRYFLN